MNKDFIEKIKSELGFGELHRQFFEESLAEIPLHVEIKDEIDIIDKRLKPSGGKVSEKDRKKLQEKKKALLYARYVGEVKKSSKTTTSIGNRYSKKFSTLKNLLFRLFPKKNMKNW